jgi:hypothetical protein
MSSRARCRICYGYFLCRSRQDGECTLPHLPAWQVEDAIRRNYTRLRVPDDFAEAVRDLLYAAFPVSVSS